MSDRLSNETARPSGITSPISLAHVVLQTSRMDEQVAWYETVLNARTVYANAGGAFLAYDEEHHRVAFVNIPDLDNKAKKSSGVNHIAFSYRTLEDLLNNHVRLEKLGIMPAWSVNHGMTTSLYYNDPDGNHVELQVDNFDDPREAAEYMFSEAFAENMIGVDIDPHDLRRRMLAGENMASLLRRPPSGPRGMETVPLL